MSKPKIRQLLLAVTAAVALGLVARTAHAAVETLTFEGLQNNESINTYYDGGSGGNGSTGGPNYGITFGSDSLALIESSAGGTGNFSNPPSGVTVAYFLTGPGDVMNVSGGFTTGFSFYYSDQVGFTGSVSVYSGANGTGNLLASLGLPSTPNPYNVFVPVGVSFAGKADSVVFSGSANYIAFDNVTLGASMPVPEPMTLALLGSGLAGLGVVRFGRTRRA